MKARRAIVAGLILMVCMMAASPLFAGGDKLQIQKSDTIKDVLERHAGQGITLRLQSGEEMSGTLSKVGDQVVHLSGLSGRDFYDAVIRIDVISAVIIRARNK